jgi:hypothetical protein
VASVSHSVNELIEIGWETEEEGEVTASDETAQAGLQKSSRRTLGLEMAGVGRA